MAPLKSIRTVHPRSQTSYRDDSCLDVLQDAGCWWTRRRNPELARLQFDEERPVVDAHIHNRAQALRPTCLYKQCCVECETFRGTF